MQNKSVNWDKVVAYLQQYRNSGHYHDLFQLTPYWQIVRNKKYLDDDFCCQTGYRHDNTKLNVHHKTYDWHGYEVQHPETPITLCESCHHTIHQNGNGKLNADYAIKVLETMWEDLKRRNAFTTAAEIVEPLFTNRLDEAIWRAEQLFKRLCELK